MSELKAAQAPTGAGKSQTALAAIEAAYLESLKTSALDSAAAPAWLREKRRAAAAVWLERGLPTRKDERWKYTNLSLLAEGQWQLAETLSAGELPLRSSFPAYPGESSVDIALLNGRMVSAWSRVERSSGVRVSSLFESMAPAAPSLSRATDAAASTRRELSEWQTLFAKFEDQNEFAFESLNTSLASDVIWIDVAPNTVLEKPIVISEFALATESLNEWSAEATRVLVTVGRGAQVSIAEFSAGEGRAVSIPMFEAKIEQAGRLSHARFNLMSDSSARFGIVRVDQARDSFYENYQFALGSRLTREDLVIRLNEPGAEAVLDGLSLCKGRRHVDHSTAVEHVAPNTASAQLYKAVLDDETKAVFNGRVHIHRDAQQSNAAQLNNNLLLSSKAEADTKPELEIDADDVKASHGATIGQIDPEHVFYLQARSIPKATAISMLSRGFAMDVVFRLQSVLLRHAAETIVGSAFDRAFGGSAKGGGQ